ncbi:MAG TPA: cysteine desulfurase DndA [Bryobacteraceae bacterium]|nr:cysteine desulfurase DndA [Bryobacteraceae bacterium]
MSIVFKTKRKKSHTTVPVYLDCAATSPLEPMVRDVTLRYLEDDFGNAGSRTHEFGSKAKAAVQKARIEVAALTKCQPEEVVFTSGATESNNLALLGLRKFGEKEGRNHIVTTSIEHKAVLEPLAYLAECGFEVTIVDPEQDGVVSDAAISKAVRSDTLLVSVMHVNNETGAIQPISQIAKRLANHPAFLHVDAAQGFGKRIKELQDPRIDLISVSGHKIYAPKGVGALITRRRGFDRVPLEPLTFGGGQERSLRPGTQPVALIAALGEASRLAAERHTEREKVCRAMYAEAVAALTAVGGVPIADPSKTIPSTLNIAFPGLDAEALIVALKDQVAVSNGSACTSHSYTASHVLTAMKVPADRLGSALRLSWCHLTPPVAWKEVAATIAELRR